MKTKKTTAVRPTGNGQNGNPTRDQIALLALAIWENEGRPEGRDLEHWLQAEAQLQQGRRQVPVPA